MMFGATSHVTAMVGDIQYHTSLGLFGVSGESAGAVWLPAFFLAKERLPRSIPTLIARSRSTRLAIESRASADLFIAIATCRCSPPNNAQSQSSASMPNRLDRGATLRHLIS